MFEDKTYENILNDMLSRVPSDVDKREGSIIYDALAPAAYELAQVYFSLNNFIDLVSGDTAVGEYLDRVVADYGITRKQATNAIRKIETDKKIELGTRWGIEDIYYTVTEKITDTAYKAICSKTGTIGNIYNGTLQTLDNITNVAAILTDIIESGADEETDNNLRERFYAQIQKPATSGNVDNYKNWALEVEGVGDVKVFPLANGPGTVKLLVVDSNMNIDETLEEKVFKHIEEVRPIGVQVIVESPISRVIDVSANIVIDTDTTLESVTNKFTENFINYLKGITFETYIVSYAKVGSILLNTEGVLDYSYLKLNNGISNITINEDEMAIAGEINLVEVE